jgi:DNA polymerase-3 subunit gamma/tau
MPAMPKPQAAQTDTRKPEAKQATYTRPSRGSAGAGAREEEAPEPEPEPEPEPAPDPVKDEDLTDAERDEMIATARNSTPDPREDPEQIAIALLTSELGATPIN